MKKPVTTGSMAKAKADHKEQTKAKPAPKPTPAPKPMPPPKRAPVPKSPHARLEPPTETPPLSMALAAAFGPELSARIHAVAERRGLDFYEVLQEAVQKYLESELVAPTTREKDHALYPATEAPLEEAPLLRSEGEANVVETPGTDLSDN